MPATRTHTVHTRLGTNTTHVHTPSRYPPDVCTQHMHTQGEPVAETWRPASWVRGVATRCRLQACPVTREHPGASRRMENALSVAGAPHCCPGDGGLSAGGSSPGVSAATWPQKQGFPPAGGCRL